MPALLSSNHLEELVMKYERVRHQSEVSRRWGSSDLRSNLCFHFLPRALGGGVLEGNDFEILFSDSKREN